MWDQRAVALSSCVAAEKLLSRDTSHVVCSTQYIRAVLGRDGLEGSGDVVIELGTATTGQNVLEQRLFREKVSKHTCEEFASVCIEVQNVLCF